MTTHAPLSNNELECKYGIYTYSRLRKLPSKECSFLVEDLIPPKQIGILVAEWGLGKSPLAIQLQVAVGAGNSKFLGRFKVPPSPTRVLYADYENAKDPILEIQGRIAKFLNVHDLENIYVFGANYTHIAGLDNPSGLRKIVQDVRPELVIADPLRVLCPDALETQTQTMELIKSLRHIAQECDCSILIIHHPVKPREDISFSLTEDPTRWMTQASGPAALVQNTDFRIGLERINDDSLTMRHFVRTKGWYQPITLTRVRDEETGEPLGYRPKSPVDDLGQEEAANFRKLPNPFSAADVKKAFCITDNPANERLKYWRDGLHLVRRIKHGVYEKLWDEEVSVGYPSGEPIFPSSLNKTILPARRTYVHAARV